MKKLGYALLLMLCLFGISACTDDKEILATAITISGETEVEVNKTITLTATVEPSNATLKTVTWSSSDQTKATINTNGVVTGISEGEVTITAKVGKVESAHTVTVKAEGERVIDVTDITISGPNEVEEGAQITLTAVVLPENATNKAVTWTSSDVAKATVTSTGVVTGVSEGEVKIKAKSGNIEKEYKVTVKAATAPVVPVNDIQISGPQEVIVGEQITLTAVVLPDNATSKIVTWTSSDDAKATISSEGVVTGVAEAEVTFTATVGNVSKKYVVNVKSIEKTVLVHYKNWTGDYSSIGAYSWNTGLQSDWIAKSGTDDFGATIEFKLNKNTADTVGVIVMDGGWSDELFKKNEAQWNNATKGTGDILINLKEFKNNSEEIMDVYVFYTNGNPTPYFETKSDKANIIVLYYDAAEAYEEKLGVHAWGGWEFFYDEEKVPAFGQWATPATIFVDAAKSIGDKTVKGALLRCDPTKMNDSGFLVYAGGDDSKKTDKNASELITDFNQLQAGDLRIIYISQKVGYYGENAYKSFIDAAFTQKFDLMQKDLKGNLKGTYAYSPTVINVAMALSVKTTKEVEVEENGQKTKKNVIMTPQELLASGMFALYLVEGDKETLVPFKEVSFNTSKESNSQFVFTLDEVNKLDNTKKYVIKYTENEESEPLTNELDLDTKAPTLEFKDQPETGVKTITISKGTTKIQIPDYVAKDDRDGVITKLVYVSSEADNTVDTTKAGTNTIKLYVEDKWGNKASLPLDIVVSSEGNGEGQSLNLSVTNQKKVTIKVWLDDKDGEYVTAVLEKFNEKYPHINVEFTHYGTVDSREALKTSGASGLGADVFQFPHDHMAQALLEDLVYPLPNTVMNELEERLSDVAFDIATTNYNELTGKFEGTEEKMFAVPISIESVYLYYNKDLITEEEIPSTWEGIIAKAADWESKNEGKRFFITSSHWADGYFLQSIFSGYGFRPFGPNGNEGSRVGFAVMQGENEVANPNLAKALKFLVDDLRPVVTGNGSTTSVQASEFENGKAAIIISGPWSIPTYRDAKLNVGAKLMPTFAKSTPDTIDATNNCSTFAGAQMVAVYKYSNHVEEATTFVQFLASDEAAKVLYEVGGDCPALKTELLEEIDGLKDDEVIKVMLNQLETSIPMPTIPEVTYYWSPVESLIKNDLWMKKPNAEAINKALLNAEQSFRSTKNLAGK